MATVDRRPLVNPLAQRAVASRIATAFRHLWWAVGTLSDGTVLYVPAGGQHMVAVLDGVAHATTVSLRPTRRRTVDTACGIEHKAKPLIVHTELDQALVPIWPPPARLPGAARCEDCVAATGKKRPDAMYVGLSFTTEEPAA